MRADSAARRPGGALRLRAAAWPLLASALIGLSAPAAGERFQPARALPLWEVGLGAGWAGFDDYVGAAQRTSAPLLYPHVVYRGRLSVNRSGVRGMLYDRGAWRAFIGFGGNIPVDSSGHDARGCLSAGAVCMPDLPWVVQAGPTLEYALLEDARRSLSLRLPLLHGAAVPLSRAAAGEDRSVRSVGWTATPRVDYRAERQRAGSRLRFSVGAGLIFQQRRFNHFYYGVESTHAVAGLRSAYAAPGGFAGWRLAASLSYHARDWSLFGYARYRSLDGAAFRDSPLVRRRHSLNAGFSVARLLWRSSRLTSRWRDWED